MKIRGLFFGLVIVTVCSACSVIKDSKSMKSTLEDLNKKGDQLAKRISDVEVEATFDRSYKSFIEETERLFGENGKDGVSSSRSAYDPDLVIYAQAAIKSLLFQFWKGDYSDTIEALDNRYSEHVDVFFARTNKHIRRSFSVDEMNPDRSYKGVSALGAFLDVIRPEYAEALERANLPRLSLYEVIVRALNGEHANGPQPLLPKTHAKVLQWKQEAVQVLQLRHNMLPIMVVARMTDLQDRESALSKLWMILRGVTVDLNHRDPQRRVADEQLIEWMDWLNKAHETRRALRHAGYTPIYNNAYRKLLRAVDFGQDKILNQPTDRLTTRRAALERQFAEVYEQVSGTY